MEKTDIYDAKLTYLLRTSPCFLALEILSRLDKTIHSSPQKILNITLKESQWEQSSLPVSLEGLGIRKATDISLPAFIYSTLATKCECLTPAKHFGMEPFPIGNFNPQNQLFRQASLKWIGNHLFANSNSISF